MLYFRMTEELKIFFIILAEIHHKISVGVILLITFLDIS